MASAFNLTAQINLQGPTNLKPVVSKIKKELGNIKANVNIEIKANSAKNLATINSRLKELSKSAKEANFNIKTLNTSLDSLANGFSNLSSRTSSVIGPINSVTKSLSSNKKSIQDTTTQIEEFGKQSGLAIKRFAAFSVVSTVIYGVVNAVNSAFKEFVTFNKEIVRLSQVTGESVANLKGVSDEISRLASDVGVASSDLLTVSVTLAQAGLSATETKDALEALAKSALAPSFDNLNDTTEGSIAIMRQFGIAAGDLESALGSVNSVAAKFAVEASDLIAAVQRTGGVFAASSRGVSEGTDALNEFLAIFTSVRQTTRESAETIATGLRTIFTRIQRKDTVDALKEYGIILTDLEGKFVGPFEATKRLSEGLSQLDPRDIRFSSIVEELGGFRQIGKVIPLIQQFAVAQEALKVAQRGQGSLAKDAITAQQSLAVQFTKTRENFVALVREIGDSGTFKALTNVIFGIANALINVTRALEPLLPLLVTFAAIKVGSSLTEFFSGFAKGALGGRGGGGIGGLPTPTTSPTSPAGGGTSNAATLAAINNNTTILTTINQSILALNQNLVNTNSLLLNRPQTRGFASGGLVPGRGNRDTYSAMLTPGEFVIRKKAVEAIGLDSLTQMNNGGFVQKFADGSPGGVKKRRGARSKFKELSPEEISQLSTAELIRYGKALAYDIFTTGGAGMAVGMEFVPVPKERIIPELDPYLKTYRGQRGFWQEIVEPFGRPSKQQASAPSRADRASSLEKQVARQSDEVAARSQQWSAISSGSAIDNYLLSSLKEPVLSDYRTVRGGGSLAKQFHNTRLRQAVNKALDSFDDFDYSSANIDKLVSGMAAKRFANGGLVQKLAFGGRIEDRINFLKGGNNRFGLVGLKSGTGPGGFGVSQTKSIDLGGKYGKIDLDIATLSQEQGEAFSQSIESAIEQSFIGSVTGIANQINAQLKIPGNPIDTGNLSAILKGSGLANVVGAALETSIALTGAEYWDKTESTKSIDFPFGLGPAAGLFGKGFPGNIPTDVTKTIGGVGKAETQAKEQIKRFIDAIYGEEFTKAESARQSASGAQALSPILSKTLDTVRSRLGGGGRGVFSAAPGYTDFIGKWGSMPLKLSSTESFLQTLPQDQQQSFIDDYRSLVAGALRKKKRPVTRASGGGISGQDTVPALLTPGEFVFTKKAAQRIGYSNLNRLNRADKITGFNKGGIVGSRSIVQRFAGGSPGGVQSLDGASLAGFIALFTNVLQPQVEKLASSFGLLSKDVVGIGTALSGAVKEATSLVSSAALGLSAVGASRETAVLGAIGGGVGGAIGGGLSAVGTKTLDIALEKNTKALAAFEKSVKAREEATDEESRIRASREVEDQFFKLSRTLESTKNDLNFGEVASNLGGIISSTTTNLLTLTTALTALTVSVNNNKIVTDLDTAAEARSTAVTNASSAAEGAKVIGTAATGLGLLGRGIGAAVTGIARFAGVIGLVLSAVQIGYSIYSALNTNLKKSAEQSLQFSDALLKATKSAVKFSLNNERYSSVLIKKFDELNRQKLSGAISESQFFREIGGITAGQGRSRITTGNVDIGFSDLNTVFIKAIDDALRAKGVIVPENQDLVSFIDGLKATNSELLPTIEEALRSGLSQFTEAQFIAAKGAEDVPADKARSEFLRLQKVGAQGQQEIIRVVEEYTGKVVSLSYATNSATLAAQQFKTSLTKLDDVFSNVSARIGAASIDAQNSLKDLDFSISALSGKLALNRQSQFERNAQMFGNVAGFDENRLRQALGETFQVIGQQQATGDIGVEFKSIQDETVGLVLAFRRIQRDLPTIFDEITQGGAVKTAALDKLKEQFGLIFEGLKLPPGTKNDLIDRILRIVESSGDDGAKTLDELKTKVQELGKFFDSAGRATEFVTKVNEEYAKVLGEVSPRLQALSESILRSNELFIDNAKLQAEFGTGKSLGTEIRKVLGAKLKSADIDRVFNTEISGLVQGLSDGTDVSSITKALNKQIAEANLQAPGSVASAKTAANIQRLNTALEKIRTSSERLSSRMDELAEREKQLFQAPRDLFDELLMNPQSIEEILSQAAQADRLGRGDQLTLSQLQQANQFRARLAPFNPDAAEALFNQIITKVLQSAQVAPEDRDKLAALISQLTATPEQKATILDPEIKAIQAITAEMGNASSALQKEQAKIQTILEKGITATMTKFQQDLSQLLPEEIRLRQELINKLREQTNTRILSERTQLEGANTVLADIINRLRADPRLEKKTVDTSLQGNLAAGEFGADTQVVRTRLSDLITEDLTTPVKSFGEAIARIDTLLKLLEGNTFLTFWEGGGFGGSDPAEELRKILVAQRKQLEEAQRKAAPVQQTSPEMQDFLQQWRSGKIQLAPGQQQPILTTPPPPPQPTPAPTGASTDPRVGGGAFNIPRLEQSFDKFIGDFERSFSAQASTFGSNLVTDLNIAMASFNNNVNTFKSVTEQFVLQLDDFNRRGGIKGPNIPQEVAVAVRFDDDITVVAENNNQNILDQIGVLVADTVREQLNNLRVFG